jgi:hypothetical protein
MIEGMSNRYKTDPVDANCRQWTLVGDWLWTTEPLYDEKTQLYAHLTYAGALAVAARLGAQLPNRADIIELRDTGFQLAPVTLPDRDMIRAAGLSSREAIDRYRNVHMCSLEWAKIHDDRVRAALATGNWDGVQRVSGAGKHWTAAPPPGRSFLMGWWNGTKWIQDGTSELVPGSQGPHDAYHHDYATTTIVKKRAA